jgi:ABC-type branched-subunit amino acid transport system substrate-binding protein
MKRKSTFGLLAAFVALTTVAAGCSSSSKSGTDDGATTPTTASSGAPAADFVALGGWKDPACNPAQPKVVVGISAPIDVAGTALADYVDGTQAAVVAFNGRGGISGRCLDLKVCDGKGDGPTELSCARQETEDKTMVAGLASTFIQSEGDAYQLFQSAGLSQIGAQVTQPGAWNSPVSYEFTMGGSGTLLAGMPALKSVGVKKFVIFVPASGQVGALAAFANPLVKALGMTLSETIQIPPTAVDFTQFVLAAQNKSAEGGVLALPGNVGGQVIDAADSLSSDLKLSSSWGTFSQRGVTQLPDTISKNMAFTDAVPPVVADSPRWPVFNVIIDDFKASGKADLAAGSITAQATNGWLSVYALVKVMRGAKPTTITRAGVKKAFDQAKNIPMFKLIPAWTPSQQSTNPVFKGISNPMYWTGHWDADKKQFVVDDKQVDILALLG